jgi:hypothetical protein
MLGPAAQTTDGLCSMESLDADTSPTTGGARQDSTGYPAADRRMGQVLPTFVALICTSCTSASAPLPSPSPALRDAAHFDREPQPVRPSTARTISLT